MGVSPLDGPVGIRPVAGGGAGGSRGRDARARRARQDQQAAPDNQIVDEVMLSDAARALANAGVADMLDTDAPSDNAAHSRED